MPFVKLDTGILDSSLWSEPAQTCKCWITLLAMADAEGFVRSTAPGIARRANLGLADTEKALEIFESPDSHSRTLNDEGRRIKRTDGGYQIVNYEKYRERDYTAAERQKRWREKHKANAVTPVTRNVTSRMQKQSTEADTDKRKRKPLSLADCVAYAKTRGISASDAEAFFDSQESGGWTRGGKALRDWQAALRTWKSNGWLASQRQRKNGARPDQVQGIDKSKIEVPERFKAWVAERYPARREDAMKWQTWADVPRNGLRGEWWKEEKAKLPIGDMM